MEKHRITIEIVAEVPGDTTLDRMDFLLTQILQVLESEQVEVMDMDWLDSPDTKEGE